MVGGGRIRSSEARGPGAQSALTSVVVHASGAVCTRRARLVVAERDGEVAVRVAGLPATLYEHSLRGRVVSGPPGLRVTDARVDLVAALRRADELPGLRLDLEDAEDRRSRLRDRRDRLTGEAAEVAGFRAEPPRPQRGDAVRWAPVESILTLAGFVDSRLAVLHERLRATEDELARADHDVDVLRRRLEQTSTALHTERVEPLVSAALSLAFDGPRDGGGGGEGGEGVADREDDAGVTDTGNGGDATAGADGAGPAGEEAAAAAAQEVELELEYQVPGATWAPVYQLRLDASSGAGTLGFRACVAQRTGEDWTGVRLALSTADLLRRAGLPELRSLRIGRMQEDAPAPDWREPPAGLAELFAGYDSAVALPAPAPPPGAGPAVPGGPAGGPPLPSPLDGTGLVAGSGAYGGTPGPPAPAGAPPGPEPDERVAVHRRRSGSAPAPGAIGGSRPTLSASAAAPGAPAPAPAAPAARAEAVTRSAPQQASQPAASPAAQPWPAAPEQPAPQGRPSLPADMLDYTRLSMTGPDAPEGRGTLRPGTPAGGALVAERRRRAGTVDRLSRPAHAVDVRVSAGSFDYRFDTAAPADVEGDGRWHTVPVTEVPVRTESEYVCVPSVDQAVFGTVLVTNTSPHPLLAGPVDVTVDGDFVRTAALPTLAPGQRQAVGVGVAESVQVARRTHMRESTARLRSGTTVLDHTVEVEVANRLPYPVLVEVRERVPVPADRDVRVEEHRAQPPWEEPGRPLDGQDGSYVRGVRVWRVTLEPGRTTTLTGGYEIRLPAGKAVVGGNRRH